MRTPSLFASLVLGAAACSPHVDEEHPHPPIISEVEEIEARKITVAAFPNDPVTAYFRPAQTSSPQLRVIILPGTPSSIGYWGGAIQTIDRNAEVYAIERPGYHGSGPNHAVTDIAEQASVVGALLTDAPDQVALIGQSYGSSVALKALDLYRDRIDAIILVSPYVAPVSGRQQVLLRFVRFSPLRFIFGAISNRPIREIESHRKQAPELMQIARESCTPVRIIYGDKDDIATREKVTNLAALFPDCAGADVETIENGDHYLTVHAVETLSQLINESLANALQRAKP